MNNDVLVKTQNKNRQKFTPQSSPYKVSVRRGIGDGNWMNYSSINFQISLDNKKYYGDYLLSIFQWAEARFSKITIILCDTLQRYNLMFEHNITEEEACVISRDLGKKWLTQNQSILSSLNVTTEIFYWDNWLFYKDEIEYNKNILKNLHIKDTYFRNECEKIFDNIWDRFAKNNKVQLLSRKAVIDNLIKPYFYEETAVTDIFLSKLNGINAYPGSLHPIWDDFVAGKFGELEGFKNCTFLSLNLVKNN